MLAHQIVARAVFFAGLFFPVNCDSRLRPVPEPLGIDVDRRRNYPVDLARHREPVIARYWAQPPIFRIRPRQAASL